MNIDINFVIKQLQKDYPDIKTELIYNNSFQLLVAVILSAQTTDKQVNKATTSLFKYVFAPIDIVNLGQEKLEEYIKSIGLYKKKSKNIFELSKILYSNGSNIPSSFQDLIKLPGVGMKTAKVVLNILYGVKVVPVDTHIHRVVNRLGVVKTNNPNHTSELLEKIIENDLIINSHNLLIHFGRYYCQAKSPKCMICKFSKLCFFNNFK